MPIKVTCWQARETGYTLAVVPQRHMISVLANEEESIYGHSGTLQVGLERKRTFWKGTRSKETTLFETFIML
jgi:hypothetical protein